ncbi:MAG: PAS domain S-box protein [Geobacter sp.]|nr:PAS domain S-box protein [Geobacter sp.]
MAVDITEQKLNEESLRKSEERHRTILRTAMDGIWLMDLQGRFLEVNETYCRMSGYSMHELLTLTVHDIEAMETCDDAAAHIKKIIEQGNDRFETRHRRKDGSVYEVEVSAQFRPVEGGQIVSFIQDISERKRSEAEKATLEGQLRQAQKMESIGRLAGGVAHDFNNMLGVILGHTEIGLLRMDPSHHLFARLVEIRKAAERSADLTRQLLAFARKQTVTPKVVDLNETVGEMLQMLQRLIGEDITLTFQQAPDLWPVMMDPSQVDQILANLCVNARDAIEDTGRIAIVTENCSVDAAYCTHNPDAEPREYVRLVVSDDGCGMDRETQSHIFEPFYTTKEMGKGTGLGLATVYGAVRQNGGFINIYSEPGQGSTFSVYLPRHAGKTHEVQPEAASPPVQRGHETILLVEDEPAILEITSMMLEEQGYAVLAATTPGEAIQFAREHVGEINLLMTDVIMPEMNGRDLAKNLLTLYPRMKRLFMSGYTADIIAHHGVLDEGAHFIQKPFSLASMTDKVRLVLDSP